MSGPQHERSGAAAVPSHPTGRLLPCDSPIVAVLETAHDRRLVATTPIRAGTRLFTLEGRETPTPTRYSLQIGAMQHLDQDCAHDEAHVVQQYFWRYMNHSCEPSVVVRDRAVFALRDISPGEPVTFDYNTTEYDMAEPFQCHCGSSACVGTVRGARHLAPAQRMRVAEQLSPWLID